MIWQNVGGDPTRHIDTACRQKLHREIAGLRGQNRNKHVNGRCAQLTRILRIDGLVDDHERRITG